MTNLLHSILLVAALMCISCGNASACEISYIERHFLGFEKTAFLSEPGYLNHHARERFLWSSANFDCEYSKAKVGDVTFNRNSQRPFGYTRGWYVQDEVARYEDKNLTTIITDGTLGKPTGMVALQCLSEIYEREGKASCDIPDEFIYGSLKSFPGQGAEQSCVYYAIVTTEFGELTFKRLANQCDEGFLRTHLEDFKIWMVDVQSITSFLTGRNWSENGK